MYSILGLTISARAIQTERDRIKLEIVMERLIHNCFKYWTIDSHKIMSYSDIK